MAVLGLDIGADTIKAVELSGGRGGARLLNYGLWPTPPEVLEDVQAGDELAVERFVTALSQAIVELLRNKGFKTRSVVSCLHGSQTVIVKIKEMPRMSAGELKGIMGLEVEREVPFAVSDIIMDYAVLQRPNEPPDSPNMEVLFAAVPADRVDLHVSGLLAAKLKPKAIDVQPLALCNSLVEAAEEGGGLGETIALVDMGASATRLCIVRDGVLHFPRTIPIAGKNITERLSEGLGISEQQAERLKRQHASVRPLPAGYVPRSAEAEEEEAEGAAVGALDFGAELFELSDEEESDVGFGGTGTGGGGLELSFDEGSEGGEAAGGETSAFDLGEDLGDEGPTFDFGTDTEDSDTGGTSHTLGPPPEDDDEDAPVPEDEASFHFDLSDSTGDGEPDEAEVGAEDSTTFDFALSGQEDEGIDFDLGGLDSGNEASDTGPGLPGVGGGLAFGGAAGIADQTSAFDFGEPEDDEARPAAVAPSDLSPEDEERLRVQEVIEPVVREIAAEIGRSLEYYRSHYQGAVVDRVKLVGGTARIDGLPELLEEELGIPVDRADPVKTLVVANPKLSDEDLQQDAPLLAVAIGLALSDLRS